MSPIYLNILKHKSIAFFQAFPPVRGVVLSLANAAVDQAPRKSPKTKHNTKSIQHEFGSARGGRERFQALTYSKSYSVLEF
jgi:hypothetical protein